MRTLLLSILLALTASLCGAAQAQDLLDTTLTLGKKPDAVLVPFTVAESGNYRLAVTDFGTATGPARLARVDAGITRGSELVGATSVVATNPTAASVTTVPLTPGSYRLVLIGQPDSPSFSVGSAGVRIDDPVSGSVLVDTVHAFTVLPLPTASPAAFEHEFAVAAGTYTLEVTDFALPEDLALLQTTVIRKSDGALLANVSGTATTAVTAGMADTFEIFIYAELAVGTPRGLVGLALRDAGEALAGQAVHELGDWPYRYEFELAAAMSLEAQVTDLGFPTPLAELGAEIVRDGVRAAPSLLPGAAVTFPAGPGLYAVYVSAEPAGAVPGSFGLRVAGAETLVDKVQNVVSSGPATDVEGIDTSFDISIAGTYTLTLTDFGAAGFFDAFTSLDLALTRDSQIVQTLNAAGSFSFAAMPGRYSVAILADPAGSAGEGLLGVSVAGGPSNSVVFDVTEAVGTDFISASVSVASAESVDVNLTDLGFPASFSSIRAAVTRGAERVGEVVGGGSFTFAATPGTYLVNVLATPSAALGYGTVGLNVRATPPLPAVLLTASAASVTVGGNVSLSWSATNASTCVASGGWSGSRPTTGSTVVSGLNADTTFTLACTGLGGSATAAVTVNVTAERRSSGGGSVDLWFVAFLLVLALGVWQRRRSEC